MLNQKPLFPGSSEQDQLKKIFKLMGTPDATKWPGIAELPDWKVEKLLLKNIYNKNRLRTLKNTQENH